MKKITKNILKSIVKECLIEILAEGVFPDHESDSASKTSMLKTNLSENRKTHPKQPLKSLEDVSAEASNSKEVKINKYEKVAKNLTADKILNEMLADTAKTTLPTQLSAESAKSGAMRSLIGVPGADKAAILNISMEINKWKKIES